MAGAACAAEASEQAVLVHGPERLVMPFSCTIEQGKVVVTPGPERPYDVLTEHFERSFKTCNPPFSNQCRTFQVHKFDILCGGQRTPWVKIVDAAHRTTAGKAFLHKGLLNIVRKSTVSDGSLPSCSDKTIKASDTAGRGECLPWRVTREVERIIIPAGFGPVTEIGARLIAGTAPGQSDPAPITLARADASQDTSLDATLQSGGATANTPSNIPAPELLNDLSLTGSSTANAADEEWIAVEEAREAQDFALRPAVARSNAQSANVLLPGIALLLAGAGLGWMAWLHRAGSLQLAHASSTVLAQARQIGSFAASTAQSLMHRVRSPDSAEMDASVDPEIDREISTLLQRVDRIDALARTLDQSSSLRAKADGEIAAVRSAVARDRAEFLSGSATVLRLRARLGMQRREIDKIEQFIVPMTGAIVKSAGSKAADVKAGDVKAADAKPTPAA